MQFTEKKIQEILLENEQLKNELCAAQKELENTARLYDMMVADTKNLLILTEEGSRSAIYVSPNVEEVLGVSRELVMNDIRELGPASGKIPDRQLFESAGKDVKIVHSEAECVDRRSGMSRPYHKSVTRIEGSGGIDRYLTVYLDAKDGTADNSRLHEILYDGAVSAHNIMLKGMSHDLRTPLNSISGYVMLLMKNPDNSAKVKEYAHRIGMSCRDLLFMINQIMDMSGSEKSTQEIHEREFALGKIINEIAEVTRSKTQEKYQKFEVYTSGIEKDIFIGDRVRIVEVLMNLLNNAIQYTPEGGEITLRVIGREDWDPGYRNVSFEVSDNGIGMSSELQKRLFDSNGDFSPIPGMLGSGVGIAMTRKFVDQMKGTISVQSTLGHGSTFSVGLRLKTAGDATDSFWSEHGVRRVLVVGENINEAARICDLLDSSGLETEYSTTGYGLRQIIDQTIREGKSINLLLLDKDIKDKLYFDVMEEVSKLPWTKFPAIILMSDKADKVEHYTQNVHKTSIDAIMPKPFVFSTFRNVVEELHLAKEGDGSEASESNALAGLRFLVAEDNAINADVLKELLEMYGAKCEIAGNGKAAVAMFKNRRPGYYDMILMDIRMPLMDGYAATAEIRQLPREDASLPILAMTADTLEEDVERSLACGMDEHIPKPLDIKVLSEAVSKLRTK